MPKNLIPPHFRKALNESLVTQRLRRLTWANILVYTLTVLLLTGTSLWLLREKYGLWQKIPRAESIKNSLISFDQALEQYLVSGSQSELYEAIWHYEVLARLVDVFEQEVSQSPDSNTAALLATLNHLDKKAFQILQGERSKRALMPDARTEEVADPASMSQLPPLVKSGLQELQSRNAELAREDGTLLWLLLTPLIVGTGVAGWLWGRRQVRLLGEAFHDSVDLINFQVAQQKALFKSIRDAVLVVNIDKKVIYFNPEAERLLRLRLSDARNSDVESLIQDEDDKASPDCLLASVLGVLEKRRPVLLPKSTILINPHREHFHVEGSVSPVFDHEDQFSGVILVLRECSELHQKELTLMARERLYRRVFNQQYEYLVVLDMAGHVMEMNEPFIRLNGATAPTPQHIKFWDLPCWNMAPYFMSLWQERLKEAAEMSEPLFVIDEYEVEVGEKRCIEGYIAVLRDEDGDPHGYLIQGQDVTERRLDEEKFQLSVDRARLLGQMADSVRFLSDPQLVIRIITQHLARYLNVSHCAYLEVDEEEIVAQVAHDHHSDDTQDLPESFLLSEFGPDVWMTLKVGEVIQIEDLSKSNSYGQLKAHLNEGEFKSLVASPICKEGKLLSMLVLLDKSTRNWKATTLDIISEVADRLYLYVEMIRNEAEAKRVNERFRLASRATNDVIWDWNLETNEVTWNNSLSLLSGYDLSEISPSMDWWMDLIFSDDIDRVKETIFRCINDDSESYALEYRILRKDGTMAGVLDRGYLLRDKEGVAVRLIGAIQDLSERIDAKKRLEDGALKLQLSLDAAAMGTWEYRPNIDDVTLDVRSREILGLDPSLNCTFEQFKEAFHSQDFGTLQIGPEMTSNDLIHTLKGELRVKEPQDGKIKWVQMHGSAFYDATGSFYLLLGTLKDVTEQKNFELSLKKAKRDLEVASKAKDHFLAALSHELRTPLTPVLMTVSMIRDDVRRPSELAKQLDMIQRNIELESRLIDDLLDLTKITQAKLILRIQPCDLHELVLHAADIVKDEMYLKKQRLVLNLKAEYFGMKADATRLQQVFWNLMRNAVKFSPVETEITVTTYNDDSGLWIFQIRDQGIGVKPENLESIFEPFEQAGKQNDHRFGGLGLGLAISKGVAQMHGGEIKATRLEENQGAEFVVALPSVYLLDKQAVSELPEVSLHHQIEDTEKSKPVGPKNTKILVVDDHESTLLVIEKILMRRGYQVRTANCIQAALEVAAQQSFHLIISDIGLPDGTGYELMSQLREKYQLTGIALSGYGTDKDLSRGIEAGFGTYLTKPIHATQLLHSVEEMLKENVAAMA